MTDGKYVTLDQTVSAVASMVPASAAITSKHEEVTYRELDEASNRLARYLRRLGVGPEVVVGILAQRSVESVVGILGILKAGGAYLPLDPTLPPSRLSFMTRDASASCIVAFGWCPSELADVAPIISLNKEWAAVDLESPDALHPIASSRNLAYIIYTSGSTGRPKGVMIEHRGAVNMIKVQQRLFRVHSQSKVLQFASLGFDASVSEIFVTLSAGANLRISDRDELVPGEMFLNTLAKEGITCLTLPPAFYSHISEKLLNVSSLETLILAGDKVPAIQVPERESSIRVINAYGPTEFSVCASLAIHTESTEAPHVGRALDNCTIYVLDDNLQPLPFGETGEVYLAGAQVARGYLGLPAETAASFLPDPFSPPRSSGERLYRTGDLGKFLPTGDLEILGRVDTQVKVRGYRVELGEIEAAIHEHPAIQHAVAILRPTYDGGEIVAYVITRGQIEIGSTLDLVGLIKNHLQPRLPSYMCPTEIIVVDDFPLSPNGKIDRGQLASVNNPHGMTAVVSGGESASTVEGVISAVWREVLNAPVVDDSSNFFGLGGHSLKAMQVLARLRDRLGMSIPPRLLFENPVFGDFVSALPGAEVAQIDSASKQKTVSQADREVYRVEPGEEST